MATGYSMEKLGTFPGSEHVVSYGELSTNPDDYEGRSVLILGMLGTIICSEVTTPKQ